MPRIIQETGRLHFKITIYGAGKSGKTTCMQYLHSRTAPERRGDLVSLATGADRTLFTTLLAPYPIYLNGREVAFDFYTVPGCVIYNAARQLALRFVDGVVFCVDSHWEKMEQNAESFENLVENLNKAKTSLEEIPYVLIYNKLDLPNAAPPEYSNSLLNSVPNPAPYFLTVSATGQGVWAAFNEICRLVMLKHQQALEQEGTGQ